jgi:hypothetical protein
LLTVTGRTFLVFILKFSGDRLLKGSTVYLFLGDSFGRVSFFSTVLLMKSPSSKTSIDYDVSPRAVCVANSRFGKEEFYVI